MRRLRGRGQALQGLESGALRRLVWNGGATRAGGAPEVQPGPVRPGRKAGAADVQAAWQELGRRASGNGWARRFITDVAHGRLSLPPQLAVPALCELALAEPEAVLGSLREGDPTFSAVAGVALGRTGGAFREELTQLARSPEVSLRVAAAAGFGEEAAGGWEQAVEELGKRFGDPAGEVRSAAITALGRARGRGAVAAAARRLEQVADAGDGRALSSAAVAAVALWPAGHSQCLTLLNRIASRGAEGRRAAARAIRDLPVATARRLSDELQCGGGRQVRRLIAAGFARPEAAACASTRRWAAGMVRDKDPMVRAASVGAVVAGLRASEIARLARDRSPLVRAAVAAGIGTPGIPQATQVLLALAKDETAAVRAAAVRSLGALGAQAPIFDARSDRDPSVRAEVAGALRPTEPRALDLLISLSHDRHRAVAQAAARNLWRNCFSLPERAASQAVELLHQEATAPAAAQGLAAAVDANPRLIGEACRLLAAGEVEPAVLWIIARAAETAEVADLARSAARSLETGEDLGAGLGDLSLALRWAGFEHVADICEWLAECAEADSQEDIGRLTAGAPRTDFEPVACLAAAARAVKKAGGARSLDSRARHLAQARATLDICTERTRDAGYRPVVDAIVKTWSVALAPLPATISTKPPEPMRLQVPTPKAEVKSRKAGGRLSAAVTNPYVVGKPLIADSPMFFGREDDLAFVERGLQSGESGAVLVLVGQRRTGKTSLLRQLEARLRRSYWCSPAFIDVQGMLVGDTDALFRQLARSALSAAEQPGLDIKGSGAEMVWDVAERLERRLVLLIDEFDDLEQKVRTGVLPPEVFSQLRSMIQHGASISLVLCGTHRVESLAGEHWSFLLNMATHRRIGALAPQAAADVIRVPLARLGIACDEAALVAAAGLAGCHPYFLQLLGYRLIENCVESGLAAVGTDDMGKAADQVIEQGAVHLRYLWDICGPKGQPIVRALTTERGSLSFEQLRSATGLGATHLRRVVRELAEAEVVQEQAGRYSVQIGLLSHWIATALPHKWL